MYAVEFLRSAAKALAGLDPSLQRRIARRIDRLASDPRGDATKLRGDDDIWRVRVGDHRIRYRVEDERLTVLLIRVAH